MLRIWGRQIIDKWDRESYEKTLKMMQSVSEKEKLGDLETV